MSEDTCALFMLAAKLPLIGLLLALVMALGMSITISLAGVFTAIAKSSVLLSISKYHGRLVYVETFLELLGAFLIIIIAALFLLTT